MGSDSKAAAVIKAFCIWFLDELFLEGKLPVLSIPKRVCNIDSLEQACSLRKLNCAESARQYAEILAVASVVTETVLCPGNKYMSQRDVYYSLKHQFTSQTLCNTRIIELGLLWELKRYEMHITPTSKGYLAGLVRFRFFNATSTLDSDWTNCVALTRQGGVSISSLWASARPGEVQAELLAGDRNPGRGAGYLLVVEKEGVYKRLCEDCFHLRVGCLMVTGCGYPDISTRACVARLSSMFPALVVLGVCDYNPHGLGLLHTYRCGSAAMAFEGAEFLTHSLRWVGLRHDHVVALASAASVGAQWPGTHSSGPDNCLPSESFEKYSKSDHAKTESLLRQFQHLQLSTPGAESYLEQLQQHRYRVYAEELSKMQAGGKKCELEALYSFGLEFICAFLERCILSEDYI